MPNYLDGEIPMTPADGVSPIDSLNKYFFLDFNGLKRDHVRFLNFFKHSNLFDVDLPHYSREEVYNKVPAFYKQSYDEFGHAIRLVEMPPCIKIEDDSVLMNLMATSDPNVYNLPTSITSTQYNNLTNTGKLLTNVIYQISKPTIERSITNGNGITFNNAINAYYEFMISSINYNSNTGQYDLVWEMLGGKEGADLSNYYTKTEIDAMIGDIESILATLTTP